MFIDYIESFFWPQLTSRSKSICIVHHVVQHSSSIFSLVTASLIPITNGPIDLNCISILQGLVACISVQLCTKCCMPLDSGTNKVVRIGTNTSGFYGKIFYPDGRTILPDIPVRQFQLCLYHTIPLVSCITVLRLSPEMANTPFHPLSKNHCLLHKLCGSGSWSRHRV